MNRAELLMPQHLPQADLWRQGGDQRRLVRGATDANRVHEKKS
jgi:hypothetical protein